MTYEAGASHKEVQALARHSTPTLTANTYGRTRNERLAQFTEIVVNRLLCGETGVNLVQKTESDDPAKIVKLLPEQQLKND